MFQGDSAGLVFRVGQAGTYYIDVHSGQPYQWGTATSQSYTMIVTATYCNDIHEPNDDMNHATAISIGQKITAYQWRMVKNNTVSGDEDWYKIQTNFPGRLTIQLVNWVDTYDWSADYDRLYVYNGSGQSIGFAGGNPFYAWMMGGGTDSTPVTISMNLGHAGPYYLRFHSGAGTSTIPYSFTTSFTSANDPFEPNDSLSIATRISFDTVYQAYEWRSLDSTMNVAGDEDCYYFLAPEPGEYNLTLNNWTAIDNWDADYDRLWVYDSSKAVVGANPYAWMMGSAPIQINIPSAGKYYIRLHCGNIYSLTPYTLELTSPVTNVKEKGDVPLKYDLEQNYPNPFNPATTFSFSLPSQSFVSLKVFDLLGREVSTIVSGELQAGSYTRQWNAAAFASGVYFYRLTAGSFVQTKKLMLIK